MITAKPTKKGPVTYRADLFHIRDMGSPLDGHTHKGPCLTDVTMRAEISMAKLVKSSGAECEYQYRVRRAYSALVLATIDKNTPCPEIQDAHAHYRAVYLTRRSGPIREGAL